MVSTLSLLSFPSLTLAVATIALLYTVGIGHDVIPEAEDYALPPLPPQPRGGDDVIRRSHVLHGLLAPEAFAAVAINTSSSSSSFLFMGLQDGRIARLTLRTAPSSPPPSLDDVEYIARTGRRRDSGCDDYTYDTEKECGRPLGMVYHDRWGLLVADAYAGVLRIPTDRATMSTLPFSTLNDYQADVIVSAHDGVPFLFANSIALAPDNVTLFLTDSSSLYHRRDVSLCLYDGRPTGRLFQIDLVTRDVQLIDSNLGFPNGVVLLNSHRLLVALTRDAAILEYDTRDLTRPPSYFAKNLPCIPDNLFHHRPRHVLTVGCAIMRTEPFSFVDFLSGRAWLRRLLLRFFHPHFLMRLAPKYGAVLLLDDETGEVRGWWGDEGGAVIDVVSEAFVVSLEGEREGEGEGEEKGGEEGGEDLVFLGSWRNPWLAFVRTNKSHFDLQEV
jgi:hypothetical protein